MNIDTSNITGRSVVVTTLTQVFCTLQVEATHCWPGCPFEEVAYLRDPHRHVFWITAYKAVSHDDRDTEFIILKHKILEYVRSRYYDDTIKMLSLGAMSCEMLARELIVKFDLTRCIVSEDNENGADLTVWLA